MAQALRTFGRILAAHWPALGAWYLGGEAVHQLLVLLAGFVGGHTTLGGLLLLPLAVAARLVSYVAMYLTVQPSLPHSARDDDGGYRVFAGAILAAILPFFAFYAAWGMLDADQSEFFRIASGIALRDAGYDYDQLGDRGGLISVGVLPVAVLVIALVVRLVLARRGQRRSAWTLALAAYVEVLWTFMLFTLIGQWWGDARVWVADRAGTVWLGGIADWFAQYVVPVAFIWEAVLWLVGLIAAVLLVPAAWLTVAGVIYGTEFDTSPAPFRNGRAALRGALGTLARTLLQRLESLWAAVALVWRGGPLLFGVFALAYALWALAEHWASRGLLIAVGGHDSLFWAAFLPLLLLAVAAIAEPLRVALIATAFDTVIGLPEAGLDAADSGDDDESGDHTIGVGDVEEEGRLGVVGEQEDRENLIGP